MPFESSTEYAFAGKAGGEADGFYGKLCTAEHVPGCIYAGIEKILVGRKACFTAEKPNEMIGTQACVLGEFLHSERFGKMLVDIGDGHLDSSWIYGCASGFRGQKKCTYVCQIFGYESLVDGAGGIDLQDILEPGGCRVRGGQREYMTQVGYNEVIIISCHRAVEVAPDTFAACSRVVAVRSIAVQQYKGPLGDRNRTVIVLHRQRTVLNIHEKEAVIGTSSD